MTQSKVTADLSELDDLIKQIGSDWVVKVGLIGSKGSEQHDGTNATNAEVGLWNEFGTENIPTRSFLRLPLENGQKNLVNELGKGQAKDAFENGNVKQFFNIMGVKAVALVQEAFATGGNGQWQANAPSTIKQKGSSSPLINTAQLRRAVDFEVVKKSELR